MSKYFSIDCGFFPTNIKLCFDKKAFHKILKDHDIKLPEDPRPLSIGVAETHNFNNLFNGESLIVVIFDLEACDTFASSVAGTVAHEANHVIERILEHIGEDHDDFGEESRSYLLQYLVEQMFEACAQEIKNAKRKEDRAATGKKGQRAGGPVLEVDKPGDNGSAGPTGDLQGANIPSGAQGPQGGAVSKAKVRDFPTRPASRKGSRLMVGPDGRLIH
jgi:hypothetical protein